MSRTGGAILWLALFGIYLGSMPGTFYFEDSPEMLACAAVLGNTHEPGYPLNTLAGKLALFVPAGSPALRYGLVTAAAAAGGAVALGVLAAEVSLLAATGPVAAWAGAFASVAWGLGDCYWWQGAIGEKYSLLYAAFVILLLVSWRAARGEGGAGAVVRLGFLSGLALALHNYAFFAFPVVLFAAVTALAGYGPPRPVRTLALALILGLLPLSLRVVYPPVRSAGGAALNWACPGSADSLAAYLSGRRYERSARESSVLRSPGRLPGRIRMAWRLASDEIPLLLLLGAPWGAWLLFRAAPGFSAALLGSVLLDAAWSLNFTQYVVRWYVPAFAVLALLSALGFAGGVSSLARFLPARGPALALALLAAASAGWQWGRGRERNGLASFYAAHDMARNILAGVPRNGVYFGRGDTDLFPLWAVRYALGEREDVEALGLAAFVDARPSDLDARRRLLARFRVGDGRIDALVRLLQANNAPPVVIMKTGYDPVMWEMMGTLVMHRAEGLTGRLTRAWDMAGGVAESMRRLGRYRLRGLTHGAAGAVRDLDRVRDEVARTALAAYSSGYYSLGLQLLYQGDWRDAAAAFGASRRLLEPLTGPLRVSLAPEGLSGDKLAVWREGAAAASGFRRFADVFNWLGVEEFATVSADNAAIFYRVFAGSANVRKP